MALKRLITSLLFSQLILGTAWPQADCSTRLTFQPVSKTNAIEWSKFPVFRFPFPVVYAGPRLGEAPFEPLRHGFSHLAQLTEVEAGTFTAAQRAVDYAGLAYGLNQPWETLESPWGNDLAAYQARWNQWLRDLSGGERDAQGRWKPRISLLSVDIERMHETDERILRLKADPQTPAEFRQLPDAEFVARYKRDLTALYAESLRYLRERADLSGVGITTYSDVPIRNTWFNVVGNTWQDWTTNVNRVNYLFRDAATGRFGGPFYDQLNFLSPSIYYYYDYPNPLAGDYLAYMLFQIEANRAWSAKPVFPYAWMRFHDCCGSHPKFIQPHMAEATAIFPFMAGARGLWLWEVPNFRDNQTPMAAYEHFVHGLYRLSQFADMFEGNYELVADTFGPELMDKRLPVWRGVFNQNKLLVAAQNPYAAEGQSTTLTVRYKTWETRITLTGREVYLCRFDLSLLGNPEPEPVQDLTVSPNPARNQVSIQFTSRSKETVDVELLNATGQVVRRQSLQTNPGPNRLDWHLLPLPAGLYIVRLRGERTQLSRKIILER